MSDPADRPAPTDDAARKRRQRNRSIALAAILGALVLIFYGITLVQLGNQSDAVDAAREAEAAAPAKGEATQ